MPATVQRRSGRLSGLPIHDYSLAAAYSALDDETADVEKPKVAIKTPRLEKTTDLNNNNDAPVPAPAQSVGPRRSARVSTRPTMDHSLKEALKRLDLDKEYDEQESHYSDDVDIDGLDVPDDDIKEAEDADANINQESSIVSRPGGRLMITEPQVPSIAYPFKASLCKGPDHGIAIKLGFLPTNNQKFNPLIYIDLSLYTVTVDSWAINITVSNYLSADWNLVQELIYCIPL